METSLAISVNSMWSFILYDDQSVHTAKDSVHRILYDLFFLHRYAVGVDSEKVLCK